MNIIEIYFLYRCFINYFKLKSKLIYSDNYIDWCAHENTLMLLWQTDTTKPTIDKSKATMYVTRVHSMLIDIRMKSCQFQIQRDDLTS